MLTLSWRLPAHAVEVRRETIHVPFGNPPAPTAGRWRPRAALAVVWLLVSLWLIWRRRDAIASGALPDTDDNLRLLQVRDWIGGQGWFDLVQHRLDPPAGADIHWSRLVDLPLAAIMRAFAPLLGPGTAEAVAVTVVPLLALLVAMAAVASIGRRAIAPGAWIWSVMILPLAGPVTAMLSPLRIDHHGWQVAALLVMVAGLVTPRRGIGGVAAGLAIAMSLAIGVELLPFLALGVMAAALGWLGDSGEQVRLRALGAALAMGALVAFFGFIPPPARYGFGCDALTMAWMAPILIGCVGLSIATYLPIASARRRAAALFVVGAVAGLALLGPTGTCLVDPYHAVDPEARRLWLAIVTEARPLYRQPIETLLAALVLPVTGLLGGMLMLLSRRTDRKRRRIWLVLLALSVGGFALMLLQTRAAVAAQALAVPGAAALGWLGYRRIAASSSPAIRVFGTVAIFLLATGLAPRLAIGLIFARPAADPAGAAATKACMQPTALAALDAIAPATILAPLDMTPALILHSHHSGIAGPYHRNGRAIADLMIAFAGDDARARAVLRRHGARLVAICGAPGEGKVYVRRAPQGFYARLQDGRAPNWLRPVPVANTPWRVWAATD